MRLKNSAALFIIQFDVFKLTAAANLEDNIFLVADAAFRVNQDFNSSALDFLTESHILRTHILNLRR